MPRAAAGTMASAQHLLELPDGLELAVIEIGAGTTVGILKGVEGIKADALPELMTTGPVDLLDRLLLKVTQATLKVLDLRNRHPANLALVQVY